eukprot:gene19667-biopygen26096
MRAGARSVPSCAASVPLRRRIPSVPQTLRLVSTTRQQNCAGLYSLVPDQQANGMPVWNRDDKWLYSGTTGKWFVEIGNDHIGMGKDFAAKSGRIYCPNAHAGSMPNEVTGWKSWGDKKWNEDTGVSVTREDRGSGSAVAISTWRRRVPSVPETLRLVSTTREQTKAGFYNLVPDQQANGMPVWRRDNNWLYSGKNGKWHFAAKSDHIGMYKDFAVSHGSIHCPDEHGGLMPNAVNGWKSWGDGEWYADTGVSVTGEGGSGSAAAGVCTTHRRISPVPKTLWLVATEEGKHLGGFYNLVPDRQENGMPVWKSGRNWLYSSHEGRWFVTGDEENIAKNSRVLESAVHGGLTPDVTDGWNAGVSVTRDRDSGAAAAWDAPGHTGSGRVLPRAAAATPRGIGRVQAHTAQ